MYDYEQPWTYAKRIVSVLIRSSDPFSDPRYEQAISTILLSSSSAVSSAKQASIDRR